MMNVKCKVCGEPIPLKNIDMGSYVARCDACDVVFSAEKQIDQKTQLEENKLLLPLRDSTDIDVARFGDDLYITRKWRQPSKGFTYISIVGGILFLWLSAQVISSSSLGVLLMCLPFWMIFTYIQVAYRINSTKLIVCEGEIILRHGPALGWPSGSVPIERIAQVFCKAYKDQYDHILSYNVYLELTNGRHKRLLSGLPDHEQAVCIEQLLERHLGIENRRVDGEHNESA